MRILVATLLFGATLSSAQVNLSNVTGGCSPGGCSGHGYCNEENKCVCDYLWSSASDFIVVEDCSLSYIAMYILWSVIFLFSCLVLYQTAWVVVARVENFIHQKKLNRTYSIWKNPALIAVIILYALGIPCTLIMAIAQWVNPSVRVAFDILPTVMFFLVKFGLYSAGIFNQGPLLAAALKGEPVFKQLVQFNSRFNFIINILSIVIGGFPFITLVHYQDDIPRQLAVLRAYFFSQGIILFMQFLESYLVKLRLNFVLMRANDIKMSSGKTKSILQRVNSVQDTIISSALSQSIVSIILGSVPFLLNKHAYFLPISWIAIPSIAKRLALQIELDSKVSKSIAQRLKRIVKKTSDGSTMSSAANNRQVADVGSKSRVIVSDPTMVPSSIPMEFNHSTPRSPRFQSSKDTVTSEIEDTLLNGKDRRRFAAFIRAHYASDSLNLYDSIRKYEEAKDAVQRKKLGDAIMKRYIVDGAPEGIDLPFELQRHLVAIQKSGAYDESTFKTAKKIVLDLLRGNFFNKFMAETGA